MLIFSVFQDWSYRNQVSCDVINKFSLARQKRCHILDAGKLSVGDSFCISEG